MKTKKILSLFCSVAMLLTMFTAFSMTASAAGTAIDVSDFATLNSTIKGATEPIVINITADMKAPDAFNCIDIPNGKDITINLNSHTVQCGFDSSLGSSTLTIHGRGTIKGMNKATGRYCMDIRNGSTLIADNVKFIGGDATSENSMGGYGLFIVDSTASLTNCYVSGGKSTGTANNLSAISSSGQSSIYTKNCTFVRNSGGSGSNNKTVPDIIYDLDSREKIIIDDFFKTPIVIGSGYQNKVLGNTITDTDGSPVKADTPVTANATIPAPTYTVTIPETVDFGSVNGALKKYRNEVTDRAGKNINVSQEFTISATGVANLFDRKTLSVSIGTLGSKTTITGGENAIDCSILIGTTPYTEGEEFAEFVNDIDLSGGAENKQTGYVSINRCDITKTASYTGTMTFNITIKEAN